MLPPLSGQIDSADAVSLFLPGHWRCRSIYWGYRYGLCRIIEAVCCFACCSGALLDSYFTLQSNIEASGEFVDRKSRFIAQLVHIESEDEANAFIETVRKRHYDARHNVPAWILVDGRERQSDDGEPSRTSGMPTLEVLRGVGLKNVCCVVTRYFGGTLLGPGGLVRAYTAATQAAVAAAQEAGQIVEMTSVVPVDVHVAYPQYEQVLRLAQDSGAKVSDTDYADAVTLHLVFKAGKQEPFCAKMRELMAGREEIEVGAPEFAEF